MPQCFCCARKTFTHAHNKKCYKIDLFRFAKERIYIFGLSQANECPSISAAQGKLLPKDTTKNVTKLFYSGLEKKNIITGLHYGVK